MEEKTIEPATGQEQTPAPVAATVEQLEALRGADSEFVVSQLKTKATLEAAMLALNAKLAEAVEASHKALEAKEQGGLGGEPIGTGKKQDTSSATAASEYTAAMRQLMNQGLSAVDASAQLRRTRPELIAAFSN